MSSSGARIHKETQRHEPAYTQRRFAPGRIASCANARSPVAPPLAATRETRGTTHRMPPTQAYQNTTTGHCSELSNLLQGHTRQADPAPTAPGHHTAAPVGSTQHLQSNNRTWDRRAQPQNLALVTSSLPTPINRDHTRLGTMPSDDGTLVPPHRLQSKT